MEDVDIAEFFSETFAQSVSGFCFEKSGIGDIADDAAFANAVACPADGTDIGVVEGVLKA